MQVDATIPWEALEAMVQGEEPVSTETCQLLGEEIARCEVLQGSAIYRQLLCLRIVDAAGGWDPWTPIETWLGVVIGWPYKTANEKLRVARSLAKLPLIDDAFRRGLLSYTKVRALHNVATPENEADLLFTARGVSGQQLHRLLAPLRASLRRAKRDQAEREEQRCVRFWDHEGYDMVEMSGTLLPDEAATVRKALAVAWELGVKGDRDRAQASAPAPDPAPALDSAAAELPRKRFGMTDALVLMAESFLANPPWAGVPPGRREVLIHTVPDLSQGILETGNSLGTETVRRLACDGPTTLVERGPEGEVLDVGRRTRRISRRMEKALLVRDRCCRFPGCTRTAMLDAHHLEHWVDGGSTCMSNLVRLCRAHHRLVHEGEWSVARDDEGELAFVDPWGARVGIPGQLPEVEVTTSFEALRSDAHARGLAPNPEDLIANEFGQAIPDYGYATLMLADTCGYICAEDREHEDPPAIQWLLANDPAKAPTQRESA